MKARWKSIRIALRRCVSIWELWWHYPGFRLEKTTVPVKRPLTRVISLSDYTLPQYKSHDPSISNILELNLGFTITASYYSLLGLPWLCHHCYKVFELSSLLKPWDKAAQSYNSLFLAYCLSFVSIAVIRIMAKSKLGRKGLLHYTFYTSITKYHEGRKSRQELGYRKWIGA